ncbi:MAG: hypothetical protein MZV70_35660 [Desulfobacterales bacterium]|nr:hypothetical protein [Desulfobacterales bacterium]
MKVPVRVLMQGLAVVSGNDAGPDPGPGRGGKHRGLRGPDEPGSLRPGSGDHPLRGALGAVGVQPDHGPGDGTLRLPLPEGQPRIARGPPLGSLDRVPHGGVHASRGSAPKGRMVQYNNNKLIRSYEARTASRRGSSGKAASIWWPPPSAGAPGS